MSKKRNNEQTTADFRAAANELTEILRDAEKAIRDCGLGTEASIVLSDTPGGQTRLGFGKVDQVWTLYASQPSGVGGEKRIPLHAAPILVRIDAASKLGELYDLLVQCQAATTKRIRDASALVHDFIESIEGGSP